MMQSSMHRVEDVVRVPCGVAEAGGWTGELRVILGLTRDGSGAGQAKT